VREVPYDPERVERVLEYEARMNDADSVDLDVKETSLMEAFSTALSNAFTKKETMGTILPIDVQGQEVIVPFIFDGKKYEMEYKTHQSNFEMLLNYCGVSKDNLLDIEECEVPVFTDWDDMDPQLSPPKNQSFSGLMIHTFYRKLSEFSLAEVNVPKNRFAAVEANIKSLFYSVLLLLVSIVGLLFTNITIELWLVIMFASAVSIGVDVVESGILTEFSRQINPF
jgi:hypothetical protein